GSRSRYANSVPPRQLRRSGMDGRRWNANQITGAGRGSSPVYGGGVAEGGGGGSWSASLDAPSCIPDAGSYPRCADRRARVTRDSGHEPALRSRPTENPSRKTTQSPPPKTEGP